MQKGNLEQYFGRKSEQYGDLKDDGYNNKPCVETNIPGINDKGESLGKEFIDDISVMAKATTMIKLLEKLKQDFKKIQTYLIDHKMAINSNKSQLMIINPPKDKEALYVQCGDSTIYHQDEIKILGVTLSSNLKFDTHLWAGKKSIVQSINSKIALIKTIKPFVSQESLSQVRASLVNSTILYAAPVWGATSARNIDKIQSAQIHAARVIKRKAWQRCKKINAQIRYSG